MSTKIKLAVERLLIRYDKVYPHHVKQVLGITSLIPSDKEMLELLELEKVLDEKNKLAVDYFLYETRW